VELILACFITLAPKRDDVLIYVYPHDTGVL